MAGVALPILPVQIIWINMTTAVLLGLMLAFEPGEKDVVNYPPRKPDSPYFVRHPHRSCSFGILSAACGGIYHLQLAKSMGYPVDVARSRSICL